MTAPMYETAQTSDVWAARGPSLAGRAFYQPGYSTPPEKPQKPEPRSVDVAALREYRSKKRTQEECACKFGISIHMVRKLLKEPKFTRVKLHDFTHAKAVAMRLKGMSLSEIARAENMTIDTVRMRLREKGLPSETKARIAAATAARKPVKMYQVGLHVTPAQRILLKQLGGAKWLRAMLEKVDQGCYFDQCGERDAQQLRAK